MGVVIMEIYFNPYPGVAKNETDGMQCIIKVADAFARVKKELRKIPLTGRSPGEDVDVSPSDFVLIRDVGVELRLGDIFHKATSSERTKFQLLLQTFSRGRVIDAEDFGGVDNWVVANIHAPAPVLVLAAQNKAIALTIPTETEWCVDILCFDERTETLHNLWGQEDVSEITEYCIELLKNVTERFSARFKAIFYEGVLNDAPNVAYWEHWGFFQNMERAQKRNYVVDDDLIKNVGVTRSSILLELRMYGSGYRILFAYRKGMFPEILVGGFYKKGTGDDHKAQSKSIKDAKKRIDNYND
jgi:hypothetical protein